MADTVGYDCQRDDMCYAPDPYRGVCRQGVCRVLRYVGDCCGGDGMVLVFGG